MSHGAPHTSEEVNSFVYRTLSELYASYGQVQQKALPTSALSSQDVIFVVATESNLGMEASHIAAMFTRYPNVVILHETGGGAKGEVRAGMWTSHSSKLHSYNVLTSAILNGRLHIAEEVGARTAFDEEVSALAALEQQMKSFRKIYKESTSAFHVPGCTLSGKIGGDGKVASRLADDLVMSLFIAVDAALLVHSGASTSFPYTRFKTND